MALLRVLGRSKGRISPWLNSIMGFNFRAEPAQAAIRGIRPPFER